MGSLPHEEMVGVVCLLSVPTVPLIQEIPWLARLQGQSLLETPQQAPPAFFF